MARTEKHVLAKVKDTDNAHANTQKMFSTRAHIGLILISVRPEIRPLSHMHHSKNEDGSLNDLVDD